MKILLITDVPPCKDFSGALLTDSLCRYIPPEEIVCVVIRNGHLSHIKTSNDLGIETLYLNKPMEEFIPFFRGKYKIARVFNLFYELYSEFVLTKRLIKQIVNFGRLHNVDRVWCILQGQTIIRLAVKIREALNVPLLTQVWDHVSWLIGNNNINKFTAKRIINQYERALSVSACCGAASHVMAKRMRERGIPAIPLISSLPRNVASKSIFMDKKSDAIIIGFSGQTYAGSVFNALLDGLDSIEWKLEDKEIKLRILGYNFSNLTLKGHLKRNIEYLGYRSQVETICLLSECDLLFCPYITDSKYLLVAQTSFPAKLTTYLATGVPVLFCGNADSSPALFLQEHDAGYICTDSDSSRLMEMVRLIFSDMKRYQYISEKALEVFQTNLTYDMQSKLFHQFIQYGDKE